MIHGWDLAVATGGDTSMEPDMVEALASWFAENEAAYRGAGAIAERPAGDGAPGDAERAAAGLRAQPGVASGVAATRNNSYSTRSAGTPGTTRRS